VHPPGYNDLDRLLPDDLFFRKIYRGKITGVQRGLFQLYFIGSPLFYKGEREITYPGIGIKDIPG